ncbi:MAG: 4-hydroxy-tetrahydrodipicolinate reductase [Methanocellales archaeon]|nr:4-hydroxy-tetrahydrodipicolinate reductase [Methanocellales archaeon]MDD3291985.1 4-hydroxy-tetrahydrodipicolinate reductase [Methanocellales archaeon]MDD5235881.1 4-hydroxy-tetrahydrodipicolinate reductase [Methanocellales archaeon]MDD5485460.1 4-hydroxy-tetrahydrodipicolinate reductase [Methanocellales archaeon]
MIKVAVTGACGRMGSLIAQNVLQEGDMELVAAFDVRGVGSDMGGVKVSDAKDVGEMLTKKNPDVLVDFTTASGAVENAIFAAEHGVNLVIGTTGFTPRQQAQMERAIDEKVAAVISPNFSVGVNVFWKMIGEAAKHLEGYDVEIVEAHHRQKKDAPSGTATRAAKIISDALGGKKIIYGREGLCPREDEIGVHAVRGGDIVGDHLVLFAGDGERMEIIHRAHSRQAFASGVLRAIRWVVNSKKGIHSMEDVLGI